MSGHDDIATAIVKGQMGVVGPLAITMAGNVPGLAVDSGGTATVSGGDPSGVVSQLVQVYSSLTGALGVKMCHQSAASALQANPDITISAFQGL